jgi:hypothetical protein
MNHTKKSRKLLLVATTLMIIAMASVLTVYATVLFGPFTGGTVTVGGVSSGSISYSGTNDVGATWTSTLSAATGADWFAMLEITGGYHGSATVTFQLQQNTGSGWSNFGTAFTTGTITLSGSSQNIYASSDGTITGNKNWGTGLTGAAYQIIVTVNSA